MGYLSIQKNPYRFRRTYINNEILGTKHLLHEAEIKPSDYRVLVGILINDGVIMYHQCASQDIQKHFSLYILLGKCFVIILKNLINFTLIRAIYISK